MTRPSSLLSGENLGRMFKMRGVLRHISNAADRIADAADIMGNITIRDIWGSGWWTRQ